MSNHKTPPSRNKGRHKNEPKKMEGEMTIIIIWDAVMTIIILINKSLLHQLHIVNQTGFLESSKLKQNAKLSKHSWCGDERL